MTILFQTTFNIPAWDQSLGLSDAALAPSGDGIQGNLGNTTSNGSRDQITTAANKSDGGGGKGFRHWVGNGPNNAGGGIGIYFTPSTEIWIRYYIRHQAGFAWGTSQTGGKNMKTIYVNTATDVHLPGTFYFGYFFDHIGGHIEDDAGFGSDGGTHVANNSAFSGPGTLITRTWDQWQGGSTGDGSYAHWLEVHAKMNTSPSVGNGILEFWCDGVRVYYRDTCRFDSSGGATFSNTAMGSNHDNPQNSGDDYVDFDDVVVSTTGPIGPFSGGGGTTPILSNAQAGSPTSEGTSGAGVSTDVANGTLYWAVVTNGSLPSDAQLKAGSGGGILAAASQAVIATGAQFITTIIGLLSATLHQIKFLHDPLAAGNDSAQASVNLTTLGSGGPQTVFFSEGFEDNNAGLLARGWFDGTGGAIDNTVFSPYGGAGAIKFHWQLGNTSPDPLTGSRRHLIGPPGTDQIYIAFDWKFGTSVTQWRGSDTAAIHPHMVYVLSDIDVDQGPLAANYLDFYIEAGDVSGGNSKPRILIQDNLRVNTSQLNVNLLGTSTNHSVAGYNGHQDQATPTLIDSYQTAGPEYHNYTDWDGPSRVLLNNTWHHVAVYAKMNTIVGGIPQANGIIRFWVDGTVSFERTNVYLRTNQYPTMKFNTVVLAPYIGNGSPIAQDMWMDNLVVADVPAGGAPSSGGGIAAMRSRR